MDIITSSLTSATSGVAYIYSDAMNLTKGSYAGKNVFLKVDISGGAVSGQVSMIMNWSESSGGTYTTFIVGPAGTTKVINAGTSVSGMMTNGSYFMPLIIEHNGVTLPFKACGFIKIGALAYRNDSPLVASLIV